MRHPHDIVPRDDKDEVLVAIFDVLVEIRDALAPAASEPPVPAEPVAEAVPEPAPAAAPRARRAPAKKKSTARKKKAT